MIVDQKLNKQFVGVYLIDGGDIEGTQLATTVKPSGFRILMTKWLLGWEWMTIKDAKAKAEALKLAKAAKEAEKLASVAEPKEVK
jgi:hypothetical protein